MKINNNKQLEIMNFSVVYKYSCHELSNGNDTIRVSNINIYDEKENVVQIPLSNGVSFWGNLNKDFEIKKRLRRNFNKGEVFAIKDNRSWNNSEYEIFIPKDAIGLAKIGTHKEVNDGYEYFYDVYAINGSDVKYLCKPSYVSETITAVDKNTIKFMSFVETKITEERKQFLNLVNDIETTCGISIDTWKFDKIVKHYDITKKK